jgi:TetR/AcrR family transcriptional regulator, transcriptional repressor for nem operon
LLKAAFKEMHRSGFRSADLDAILTKAGVTKGALYYHFDDKEALGYAVVDEVIASIMREKWVLCRTQRIPSTLWSALFSLYP